MCCGECAVKPIVQADEYVAASECDQERSRVQGADRCGILRRPDDDAVAVQNLKQYGKECGSKSREGCESHLCKRQLEAVSQIMIP